MFCDVVSILKGGEMCSQVIVRWIVTGAKGSFLESTIHAFDLSGGPWMIGLGEAMFDAMTEAGPFERMAAQKGGEASSIPGEMANWMPLSVSPV